jgi:hypothetical protein
MSEKHTKGPWHADADGRIVDAEGRPVASLWGRLKDGSARDGEAETAANRALIAAAPELLAALNGILADDAPQTSLADQRVRWNARMEAARAAVAKAEGRAP